MSRRRSLVVGVLAVLTLAVHVVLVRLMAHGHVAHVLLGSGNAAPPIGAALLAVSLVVVRFAAVVIAPGALLAVLASLVAHALVGPPSSGGHRKGDQRDGEDDGAADADGATGAELDGNGTRSGTGSKSGGRSSGGGSGGSGTSIEGRVT
jgi:uncharacterized membrane protein YgcG